MRLDGITVLDLSQLLPGPFATQLLADLGAEVVKVEPPGDGDYARVMAEQPGWPGCLFAAVNHGKKSIQLDLQAEADTTAFYRLVEEADVVIEGYRPGVTERLDIDYNTLVEHNPEIIYCSVSGYGQSGPYRERVGHDINYIGFAGLIDMTRSAPDGEPAAPGYPVADMSGGLYAATSILGALLARELGTSEGEYIDISMTETVLSFAQVEAIMVDEGHDPRPGTTTQTGFYPSYGIYETKDGRYVTLAASEPKFWRRFCEGVDRPDLIEHHASEDPAEREALREEVEAIFRQQTWSEWEDHLGDADDMMFGLVKTVAEALEDPQITSGDLVHETADGYRRLRYPATFRDDPVSEDTTLPELGEHTAETLAESGVSNRIIDQVVEDRER